MHDDSHRFWSLGCFDKSFSAVLLQHFVLWHNRDDMFICAPGDASWDTPSPRHPQLWSSMLGGLLGTWALLLISYMDWASLSFNKSFIIIFDLLSFYISIYLSMMSLSFMYPIYLMESYRWKRACVHHKTLFLW